MKPEEQDAMAHYRAQEDWLSGKSLASCGLCEMGVEHQVLIGDHMHWSAGRRTGGEMAITPGPWEYREEPRANFSMISGDGVVVAGIPNANYTGDPRDRETQRANAALIAAAPDLLDALRRLVDCPIVSGLGARIRDDAKHDGRIDELRHARAIIAKAEGK